MAKTTKSKKRAQRTKSKRMKQVVPRGLSNYQQLVADPCAGPLCSPYGGERGIVQRFNADFSVNVTAGFTAGFFMYSPAANTYFYNGNASSNVAIAPATGVGPAGTFIGTSTSKFRPIASCVEVIPSAVSYNNITGEIGAIVTATNQVSTAGTYTVDNVFTLTTARSVLAKRNYNVVWFPGGLDHTYQPTAVNGSATLSDQSDNNSVLVAWRGYPAGTSLTIRVTVVLEWTPLIGIGTGASATPAPGIDHHKQVAELHNAHPSFWNNFLSEVGRDISVAGRYLVRKGIATGAAFLNNAAARYVGGLAGAAMMAM